MTIFTRYLISFFLIFLCSPSFAAKKFAVEFGSNAPLEVYSPKTSPLNISPNVGIGSSAPGKELDILGSVRALYFYGNGSNLTGVPSPISGLSLNYISKATSATTIGNSVIYDNGTNVGIGSTNPGQQLDIQGTVRALKFVASAGAEGNPAFTFGDDSDGFHLQAAGVIDANVINQFRIDINNEAAIYDFQSTQFLPAPTNTINLGSPTNQWNAAYLGGNGGNVGIGSVNPAQKLDVVGTVRTSGFIMPTNASAGYVLTSSSVGQGTWKPIPASGSGTVNSGSANYFSYYSADGTTVAGQTVLYTTGTNIGIGSTNPGVRFDVNGTIRAPFIYSYPPHINVSLTAASGNGCGTGTAGSFQTMPLNTINIDTTNILGGAITSNILPLPAGTYVANVSSPFFQVGGCQIRLWNSTDNSLLWNGSSCNSVASGGIEASSHITGAHFTLTATKNVILQYRIGASASANDLGKGLGYTTEVCTQVDLVKIQ